MDASLIAARTVHFGSLVALAGLLAFLRFVAAPAFRRVAADALFAGAAFQRRLLAIAWASLALAVASGAAWLILQAQSMSGRPLPQVLAQGVVGIVLTRTQFGHDWLARLALAVLFTLCLAGASFRRRSGRLGLLGWVMLALSAAALGSLAWAGHAAATEGWPGVIHVVGDILHLLAAGAWLGALVPLALFFADARRGADPAWPVIAAIATRRFSTLGIASVGTLLATGIVNTWFLAGTIPALLGTEYGHLLLIKIALFTAMVGVAAVNRLRLTPRLATQAGATALRALERNALVEATLGALVLLIVGALGTLPPGLHSQPWWPLPFRLELGALAGPWDPVVAALLAVAACGLGVELVVAALVGRRRRMAAAGSGLLLLFALGWIPLRPAIVEAFPTSFYHPGAAYAAPSIARGAQVYARNCVRCHGTDGTGNGPAAASLPLRPADLTAPHLLSHSEGDLFWWISHGRAGVMPAFAPVLSEAERWNVITFVRARAAGVATRHVGPEVIAAPAPPFPDFAFETAGQQQSLRTLLQSGPVLIALVASPQALPQLAPLAAGHRLHAAHLRILTVLLDGAQPSAEASPPAPPPFVIHVSAEAAATLELFLSPKDGGASELLVDQAGVRARWTLASATDLATPDALLAAVARLATLPQPQESAHAGHAH